MTATVSAPKALPESHRAVCSSSSSSSSSFFTPIKSLVIDDNLVTGKILSKMLEREFGHSVTCLESGAEGLKVLKMDAYDLIFMDIDMPGLDGFETSAVIRKESAILETNRTIPIIAYTTNKLSQRFFECGMDGFLAKPATPESLRSELERVSAKV